MTGLSSKTFRAEGIVIGKRNFFEADRIVEVLTLENGKIRAVVKGARKTKSKLAGSTELFTHGNFTFAKGKNLDIVTAITPLDHFQKATGDLKKVSHLFLISEALTKLMPPEVPNETIFYETLGVFRTINRSDKPVVAYEYLYKLVVLLGYGLSLNICSKCHEKIESLDETNNAFNFETGGILCEKCHPKYFDFIKMPKNVVKLLSYIENHSISEYSKVAATENIQKDLINLVIPYLNYIYQKEFKSTGFIKNVKLLK